MDCSSTHFFVVKALAHDNILEVVEVASHILYYFKTIILVCKVISDDTVSFQQLLYYFCET